VKLLLDEMWPPSIARALRERGHDVIAVAERDDLRSQADEHIFATAQVEGRVIVTENVADFRRLAEEFVRLGRTYPGLIYTTNRQFPRADARTPGSLTRALLHLLDGDAELTEVWLTPD
jgi:predicted nuclease of predicted toxin-antitoxin system